MRTIKEYGIKHLRAIEVRYIPRTCAKPPRIRLLDHHNKQSKYIEYVDDYYVLSSALDFLIGNGFNVVSYARVKDDNLMLFVDNWNDEAIQLNDTKQEV